jgi:hypothetical protein
MSPGIKTKLEQGTKEELPEGLLSPLRGKKKGNFRGITQCLQSEIMECTDAYCLSPMHKVDPERQFIDFVFLGVHDLKNNKMQDFYPSLNAQNKRLECSKWPCSLTWLN